MGAGHSHGHSHGTATGTHRDRPLGVLAITVSIMVAEVVGGLISGSLAVLADAGHMHHRCSRGRPGSLRPPSPRARPHPGAPGRTFGYMRLEILAAVINAPLLFDVAGYVLVEAVRRFTAPPKLSNGVMLSVAAVGLVANAGSLLLRGGQQASLNLRGAYLEVMGDLLGSVAVIAAAIIIRLTGCTQADAIASAAIGLMILPRTWALLREAVDVLPEATPKGVDLAEVRQHTNETPGVLDVYDLHAWTITSRQPVHRHHRGRPRRWRWRPGPGPAGSVPRGSLRRRALHLPARGPRSPRARTVAPHLTFGRAGMGVAGELRMGLP